MKALTWHGKRDVRVDNLPDPTIQEPTDVIVRITSSGICGSDLHLYEVLGPFLDEGDILGHEPTGVVAEVGSGGHRVECRGSRRRSVVAKPVTCDLSDPDALCCLADELAERNISVLGASAGIGSFGPHIQTDRAWLHRQVMVNVLATHDLVRAAPRRRL